SGGMALNRYSRASTPPAEAPTPTMGNDLSIRSPSREGSTCLGSGRDYAKRVTNSKRLCPLWPAIGGRFGARQNPLRAIHGIAGQLDLLAQLRNLTAGGLDQLPRLIDEFAMFDVHKIRSQAFERPNELQRANGYFVPRGGNRPGEMGPSR